MIRKWMVVLVCCLLPDFLVGVMAQTANWGNGQGQYPRRERESMMSGMPPMGMMPMGGMMSMGGDIRQFEVDFATEIPDEKDAPITDLTDSLFLYYEENVAFQGAVPIRFSEKDVHVGTLPDGVQLESDGAYITITSSSDRPLNFELTGATTDGALHFNVKGPLRLFFNNLTLKSQRGDAILVEGKQPVYAVLAENSMNELSDCRNPEMPPMMGFPPGMGAFPMMGPPAMGMHRQANDSISRRAHAGMPFVPRQGNDSVFHSGRQMGMPFMHRDAEENPEDYHVQYGIRMKKAKMKEKLKIDGTFVCAGPLSVSGKGTLKVQSNNKVGIKSKSGLMFRPGNMITVTALSGKGVNAKRDLYMYGGVLNVDCSMSADKALTSGRNMYIKGGHVVVKAAGSESSEGLESKFLLQIDGGKVEVAAQDDAINSQGDLVVNGGVIRAFSAVNDALDSNCNMIINGGDVLASGNGMPEGGLDCSEEGGYNLFINGGNVVAIGGRHSLPEKQSRQPAVVWQVNALTEGTTYAIDEACSYTSSRNYMMGGASLLMSSPRLKEGASCPLYVNQEIVKVLDPVTSPFVRVSE